MRSENPKRERLWLSPQCRKPAQATLFDEEVA